MKIKYNINYIPYIGYTIQDILQKELKLSNRLLCFLLKNKLIFCNNNICDGHVYDTRNLAHIGDTITVSFEYPEDNSNIIPTKMPLNILYEDEWMLVLNKTAGIPTHPSMLHYLDSLSNGIKYYFDTISLQKKIRPVIRLDTNTSGLIIFAKCAYIHEQLSLQMQNNTFSKFYLALVHGNLQNLKGTINLPIARKNNSIIERCVDFENGQNAVTDYEVIKYIKSSNSSLVKCHLLTGRTHQIRVHFSAIGHPLVGDSLYGCDDDIQCLHCYILDFVHPVTGEKLHFENLDTHFLL